MLGIAYDWLTSWSLWSSGAATVTPPTPGETVTAGGTPLVWRVRGFPRRVEVTRMEHIASPAMGVIPMEPRGRNRLIVDQIEDPEVPALIAATAVAWEAFTAAGVSLGSGAFASAGNGEWRATLNLASAPSARLLDIRVTVADGSTTTVRYTIAQEG